MKICNMVLLFTSAKVATGAKVIDSVLMPGVVVEEGTPEKLDANGGIYHHMVETQMESMEWKL